MQAYVAPDKLDDLPLQKCLHERELLERRVKELENQIQDMLAKPGKFRIMYGLYINLQQDPYSFLIDSFFSPANCGEVDTLISVTPIFYTPDNRRFTGFTYDYTTSGFLSETVLLDDAEPGIYKIGYEFDCSQNFTGINELKTKIYVLSHRDMNALPEIDQATIDSLAPNRKIEWTVDFHFRGRRADEKVTFENQDPLELEDID